MGTFYNPKIITDGLVLHLDAGNKKSYVEGSSSIIDKLKFRSNFSIQNSSTFSSDQGGSILLNGSNQYITVPSDSALAFGTGDFAIEAWVNFATVKNGSCIITSDSNTSVSYNTYWWFGYDNGQLRLGQHFTSNGAYCSWTPTKNIWYHVIATRISGTVSIYINGVSQSVTNSTIFSSTSWGQNGYIIGRINGTPTYSNIKVASVRLYNKGLTFSEVQQNYNALNNRFVIPQSFSPDSIDGLHTWLESDYGVITIDGAGNEQTTPVSGNYIKRWESKIGTINFAQTATTNMPIYRIDSNGIPYLSFEGNDTLNATIGNYNWASTSLSSWLAGWYRTGTATHQDFFSVTTGGAGWPGMDLYARQSYGTSNAISMGISSSPGPRSMGITFANSGQLNAFQAPHFNLSPFAGGSNVAWLNNSGPTSGTNTALTLTAQSYPATPTLGRYGGNYNYFTGRVYYFIAYSGVQVDHDVMYNYLSNKYMYT